MRTCADRGRTHRVHRHNRRDGMAAGRDGACRSQAALHGGRRGPGAGTDAAESEGRPSAQAAAYPCHGKVKIGPSSCPRRSANRTGSPAARSAPAHRRSRLRDLARAARPARRPRRRAQCRPTRQHNGIHRLDRVVRREQIRVASAWRASSTLTDATAGRSNTIGDARAEMQVMGVADRDAGDVGHRLRGCSTLTAARMAQHARAIKRPCHAPQKRHVYQAPVIRLATASFPPQVPWQRHFQHRGVRR